MPQNSGKLVRIPEEVHHKLKVLSFNNNIGLQKLMAEILRLAFKKRIVDEAINNLKS